MMYAARYLGSILCLLSLTALLTAQGKLVRPNPPASDAKPDTSSGSESRFTRPPPPEEVGGRSLESWMRDLEHVDASKRATAILNIVAFRENATSNPRCIAALLGRFHDGDTSPRVKAVMAFRFLPELGHNNTPHVVEELAKVLKMDTQTIVRYEAAVTLSHFAGKNRAAIPALILGATRDRGTWEIRNACVEALRGAGWDPKKGPDPEVTQALLQAMKDSTHEVRLHAIMNLGFMGRPPDPKLLTEVVAALDMWSKSRTADKTSVLWAYVSLVILGDDLREKALDSIAKYLTLKERDLRIQGINALGVLGEKARSKVPDLVNMLTDSEDSVIIAAAQALTMMNDRSQRVVRPLIDLTKLNKDHAAVILQACMSLSRIGTEDPAVIKALEDVNKRESLPKELRYAADAAIKELQKPKDDEDKPKPREVPQDRPVGRRGR